ncbi:polysaccharide deacetylase family protein [Synechocystis sp. PCC 7509]|uniref:polysaccharide deacetylase family protein n=1 Tax=Synechocystis sp. PCC 7509 TaxID=927677 RepID=UPI0002AD01D3|nr:polysaccharide deacetylase family protein [Synechocystis sp. PCC 7509]
MLCIKHKDKSTVLSNLIIKQFKKILPLALLILPTWQANALASDLPETKSSDRLCTTLLNSDKVGLTTAVNRLVQVASWVGGVETIFQTMNHNLAPQLAAYFNPSIWPKISDRATKAKVPVFMYHDILPEKEVFFDVTVKELEQHLSLIKAQGLTPISYDQLVNHLRTGLPLPEKPIMLTFDDGYGGHYEYAYPLLKKYGYPAVFSVYTSNMGKDTGRTHVNWEQLKEMAANPLITIASHSVTHPKDLRALADDQLKIEIEQSKQTLEAQLGIKIDYFTYPEGKYDQRVAKFVEKAGYRSALTMSDTDERFAGESESLVAISRFGQSRLAQALVDVEASPISQAWGGAKLPNFWGGGFDFTSEVQVNKTIIDETNFTLISGGKPVTIHAKSRYQVPEIIAGTEAVAAVDGGFFSLKFLDSNVMIGPVLSQINNKFIPGYRGETPKLKGRPLVLISPQSARFIGFEPSLHNTLEGIEAAMPNVTDAFVAAAWLVKDNQPQRAETFGSLFDYDAIRHRAFWGINQAGQPTVGVSNDPIDSVSLGSALAKAGLRDAVMLDSGASTSLAYKGESLVGYIPRPVPHVVALMPPLSTLKSPDCVVAQR